MLTESERNPAVFVGTSSDRIGSPEGKQSYFATVSKYLPFLHASVYGSLNYSEWNEAFNLPLGAAIELGKGFSTRLMYDGDRSHLLLNYFANRIGVSLMYVWLETPGVSLAVGF